MLPVIWHQNCVSGLNFLRLFKSYDTLKKERWCFLKLQSLTDYRKQTKPDKKKFRDTVFETKVWRIWRDVRFTLQTIFEWSGIDFVNDVLLKNTLVITQCCQLRYPDTLKPTPLKCRKMLTAHEDFRLQRSTGFVIVPVKSSNSAFSRVWTWEGLL